MNQPASIEVLKSETQPSKKGDFFSRFKDNEFRHKLRKYLPIVVFGLLGIIILVEAVSLLRVMRSSPEYRTDKPAPLNSITRARIVLSSDKEQVALQDSFPVSVRLVTGGRATDSTDLILRYDPKILQVDGTSAIKQGSIYKDYIISEVNQNEGIIQLSAITPPNFEGFVGIGELAQVNFTAIARGSTTVWVDFEPGLTTDTNVVETGTSDDLLDEVVNLDIIVGDQAVVRTLPTDSCDGYTQYCENMAGQRGSQFCSRGRPINGACSFDPELTTSCGICKLGF